MSFTPLRSPIIAAVHTHTQPSASAAEALPSSFHPAAQPLTAAVKEQTACRWARVRCLPLGTSPLPATAPQPAACRCAKARCLPLHRSEPAAMSPRTLISLHTARSSSCALSLALFTTRRSSSDSESEEPMRNLQCNAQSSEASCTHAGRQPSHVRLACPARSGEAPAALAVPHYAADGATGR